MKIAEVALTIVFLICVTIRCLEKSATSFRRNNWKRGQRRYFLISSCNIWPPNSQSWYLIWKPSHIWNQGPVWSDTPRNTTVAWCTVSKPIREGKWLKEPWLEHQALLWAKMQEVKLWSPVWFRTHTYTTLRRCMSWNEVFGGLQALVSSVVPHFSSAALEALVFIWECCNLSLGLSSETDVEFSSSLSIPRKQWKVGVEKSISCSKAGLCLFLHSASRRGNSINVGNTLPRFQWNCTRNKHCSL